MKTYINRRPSSTSQLTSLWKRSFFVKSNGTPAGKSSANKVTESSKTVYKASNMELSHKKDWTTSANNAMGSTGARLELERIDEKTSDEAQRLESSCDPGNNGEEDIDTSDIETEERTPMVVLAINLDGDEGRKPPDGISNHGSEVVPEDVDKIEQRSPVLAWWENIACGREDSKSGRERALWIWILVLSVICAVLFACLMTISVKWKDETAGVCVTQECVITAEKVLSSLDRSVDPCEDFFNYSCGGWIAKNPIPETSTNWDQFDILKEKVMLEIKATLEHDPEPSDPESVKLMLKLYKMCTEKSSDNHAELEALVGAVLKNRTGETSYELGAKLGRIRGQLGGNYIIGMYVYYDDKEPSKNTILLDIPQFALAKPHFQDQNSVNAYHNLIVDIWALIYPQSQEKERFRRIAGWIALFEQTLTEIATPQERRRNKTLLYNPMTMDQLLEILPSEHNWRSYFEECFRETNLPIDWNTQKIVVKDLEYFKKLGSVLAKYDSETILNYLRWRIFFKFGGAASLKIYQRVFQYAKSSVGVHHPPPTWKICSNWVTQYMGWAVSYRYVQTYFKEQDKTEISSIVQDIREGFFQILQEADWIGPQTKKIAFKKAYAMQTFVSYPEWLLSNGTALNSEFDGLLDGTFDKNHFYNFVQVTRWAAAKALKELPKSKDYTTWVAHPTTVNAFYAPSYNAITFPAGILQKPFYGYPLQSMNYGGIGTVIGHEVTHAFDDEGSQSDEKGELVNWWDAETFVKYRAKAQCFVHQYGNFTIPGLNATLNGIITQGENIADSGGLRQAFRGYQAFVKRNGVEDRLPGIDFTPEQLFFIAFAQSLCGSYRLKYLEQNIKTAKHSPWQFQVQGSIANSLDFAKTWKCPAPAKPCQIW